MISVTQINDSVLFFLLNLKANWHNTSFEKKTLNKETV